MFVLATPIVDWSAMWKICLVALAAGLGVVLAFGFLLLGLKIADRSGTAGTQNAGTHNDGTQNAAAHSAGTPSTGTHEAGSRLGGYALALVCGVICVGVVAIGIYAMTQKPSSTPAKPKSALVIPAGPRIRQIT
jgi:hypothetical protein